MADYKYNSGEEGKLFEEKYVQWWEVDTSYRDAMWSAVPAGNYDDMVAAGNYDETTDTGYMGLATSTELVDGVTLAADIGLTAGTAFNSDAGWLKFYVGPNADCNKDSVAKIVFIAKQTLRHSVSWDNIYAAGAVYGTGDNGPTGSTPQNAEVTYDGVTYKVRLMTGSATDPTVEGYGNHQCKDDAGGGSEWNDLLYRVHTAIPNCATPTIGMEGGLETKRHGGPQDGANWANFTNAELQVNYTDASTGNYTWCQERGLDTSRRVTRGNIGVATFYPDDAYGATTLLGWRPVLEVVQ